MFYGVKRQLRRKLVGGAMRRPGRVWRDGPYAPSGGGEVAPDAVDLDAGAGVGQPHPDRKWKITPGSGRWVTALLSLGGEVGAQAIRSGPADNPPWPEV